MAWFKREKKRIEQPTPPDARRVKTEGLWTKCENCRAIVWKKDLDANWRICPKCQYHFRLSATQRLELLLDSRWVEHDAALASSDPLKFTDTKPYAARLKETRRKLGKADAIITAEGLLGGRPIICCSMEFASIINPILATFHLESHPLSYFRFRVSAGFSSFHCALVSRLIAITWQRSLFRA